MRRHSHLFAALLLALASAIIFRTLAPVSATHILTDDFQAGPGRSDAYTFLWGQWWVHTALSAARSPFFCDWVSPPTGADLRFHSVLWIASMANGPLAVWVGEVRAYNVTIAALLAGAAFVMYMSLRVTFRLPFAVATAFGALFGFAPYFVFKVHAHPNLAGAMFWGGALALLLHAVLRGPGGVWPRVAFAILFWLCFWNSLVEWVMLAVAVAFVLVVAAILRQISPALREGIHLPLRWLLPTCAGLPSLAFFLSGPTAGLARDLFPPPTADVWFGFPRLSLFSREPRDARFFEYAGTGIPWGIGVLAVLGLLRGAASTRGLLAAVLGGLVILTADPWGLPSGWMRGLPFGESVRVFARFFPFALFFGMIAAALAADRAMRGNASRLAQWLVALAVALAALETWPRAIHPSPVVSVNVPPAIRASLDETKFVLILPTAPRDYPRRREAYQVELDMPFVHMGHLTRENPDTVRQREKAFPLFYSADREAARGLRPVDLAIELERLGVRYVLFDRPEQMGSFPLKGEILHQTPREILMELPTAPIRP